MLYELIRKLQRREANKISINITTCVAALEVPFIQSTAM